MDIKVFSAQQKVVDELAMCVVANINNINCNIVLPSGSDANLFYTAFAKVILSGQVDISSVKFIQGEELWPLTPNNPISFSIKINQLFSKPLNDSVNIMYLSSAIDEPAQIVVEFEKKFNNISPNITILGINKEGDFLGITPTHFNNSNKINLIDLPDNKWKDYLQVNNYWEEYQHTNKPYLISLGVNLLKGCDQLYIIATGQHKRKAIADIVDKKYHTSIGMLVKLREEQGLSTSIYIDKAANIVL